MSESRQRFTGRVISGLMWLVFLWLLFVTLPLFTHHLQVSTIDPRWLTPEDLTWRRLLYNFLSKPGFRTILVVGVGLLAIAVTGKRDRGLRKGTVRVSLLTFSLEWAIDERRNSSLAEYGNFVRAI